MASPAALLLADGRFPAGGHAHSAGAEAACADGRIVDEPSLAAFVEGRLRTAGLVDAALAAATTLILSGTEATSTLAAGGDAGDRGDAADSAEAEVRAALAALDAEAEVRAALAALDAEADARIAAPPLRAASRRLGRQLVRVAGRCWPDPTLALVPAALPQGAHQPVAWGAVGVAAGLDAGDVAALCAHHAVTTPAQAAVRLLGLDPFGVAAVTARLAPVAADVAAEATAAARRAGAAVGHAGDPSRFAGLADLPALSGPLVEIAAMDHSVWDVRMFAT